MSDFRCFDAAALLPVWMRRCVLSVDVGTAMEPRYSRCCARTFMAGLAQLCGGARVVSHFFQLGHGVGHIPAGFGRLVGLAQDH